MHSSSDFIHIFHECFFESQRTLLIGGAREPLYLPASVHFPWHRIFFVGDNGSSALHEVAHWCLAGKERRLRVDYGYWYAPEGRSAVQQTQFEQAEAKPQGLEYLFSKACGKSFTLSRDNFSKNPLECKDGFAQAVFDASYAFWQGALPARARIFYETLLDASGRSHRDTFPLTEEL